MPDFITKMKDKLLELWKKLDKNQKIRLGISAGLLLAVLIGIIAFLSKENLVSVFTIKDNNAKTLAEVDKILSGKNIAYKAGPNGEIMVDEKDRDQARLLISMAPGVSSSVTFAETWNMLKMSSTESDKKKLWEDFKKNSMIATLKKFDNIEDADVDMAIPEKNYIFGSENNDKPTASVRVKPKGQITPEQVQGIVNFVAASIEGLNPKDVKVVDNNFNLLNQEEADQDIERTSSQYKMRLKMKQELENNVKKLYQGNSDNFDYINVVANPVLDFNREKSMENEVKAPTGLEEAVVSENALKEKVVNGVAGGQPGQQANPGNQAPTYPVTENSGSTYDKNNNTINRDFTRVQKEFEKALGNINFDQSSMSVVLWYGQRVTDEAKLAPAFINQFKTDVSLATGIPAERISVSRYKMAPPETVEKKLSDTLKEIVDAYGLFAVLLMMAVGFIIAMPRGKSEKQIVEELQAAAEVEKAEQEALRNLEIKLDEKSEVLVQIENFVKEKPEAVAQLLRNWIKDEWD